MLPNIPAHQVGEVRGRIVKQVLLDMSLDTSSKPSSADMWGQSRNISLEWVLTSQWSKIGDGIERFISIKGALLFALFVFQVVSVAGGRVVPFGLLLIMAGR